MTGSQTETVVLAIDIGSSSVRAMVFDLSAQAVEDCTEQIPYELDIADGGVTLDPHVLRRLVEECVDQLIARLDRRFEIAAVGIASFWHSLLGLSRAGEPVTPIFHLADNRSAGIVDQMRRMEDEQRSREIAGTVFHSSYWPAKLRWLASEHPAMLDSVATWCSGADFVVAHLTGQLATSVSMASGTGLLDISHCVWSEEMSTVAGIDRSVLPRLVDRTAFTLLPGFAGKWPALASASWFPALGDGACANVGSNAHGPGRIALTLGTTGAMRVLVQSPAGEKVAPVDGLWTYRLDRTSILRGAAITNGGIWIDYLRELFGDADFELLDAAFALPPGQHGLTVLPFLAGERAPIWNDRARAVVAGLQPDTTPAELLRAGVESVAHRLRLMYDLIVPVASGDHAIVANGAALLRSSGLQQIVASDLEHELVTLPDDLEASARGAAMCALVDAGLVPSFAHLPDLVIDGAIVQPVAVDAAAYRAERERQLHLQNLLYPDRSSWDHANAEC